MPRLDDLRQGLFDLLGVPLAGRGSVEEGAAFSFTVKGVPLSLMNPRPEHANHALLICELGGALDSKADSEWAALLEANAGVAGAAWPRFCRNPASFEALLLAPVDTGEVSAHELFQRVVQCVDAALCWGTHRSAGPLLSWSADIARPQSVDDVTAAAASQKFRALYREVCKAAGQEADELESGLGNCAFAIGIDGVGVALGHRPKLRPDSVEIGVKLDGLLRHTGLKELEALMELNFMLALEPGGGPWVCRGPSSGELLLRLDQPLAGANGSDCLDQLARLVGVARTWAQSVSQPARVLH